MLMVSRTCAWSGQTQSNVCQSESHYDILRIANKGNLSYLSCKLHISIRGLLCCNNCIISNFSTKIDVHAVFSLLTSTLLSICLQSLIVGTNQIIHS